MVFSKTLVMVGYTAIGLVLLTSANSVSILERSTSLVYFQKEGMIVTGWLSVLFTAWIVAVFTLFTLKLLG